MKGHWVPTAMRFLNCFVFPLSALTFLFTFSASLLVIIRQIPKLVMERSKRLKRRCQWNIPRNQAANSHISIWRQWYRIAAGRNTRIFLGDDYDRDNHNNNNDDDYDDDDDDYDDDYYDDCDDEYRKTPRRDETKIIQCSWAPKRKRERSKIGLNRDCHRCRRAFR